VMYRGHILAEWENIFDIADIDGNRRGGQDFFYRLYSQIHTKNFIKIFRFHA
jgi:hypothetical protein